MALLSSYTEASHAVRALNTELKEIMTKRKPKKCTHKNGWYTDSAMIWLGADNGITVYSGLKMTHPGKVRMRCIVAGCGAVRNVYIQKRGAKAGRPFIPKAK
jgi:hypothetical protein